MDAQENETEQLFKQMMEQAMKEHTLEVKDLLAEENDPNEPQDNKDPDGDVNMKE